MAFGVGASKKRRDDPVVCLAGLHKSVYEGLLMRGEL